MKTSRDPIVHLPFELKVQIFSKVPTHNIFSLRRVSTSWHAMLSDPELEAALTNLLPFLSTARDLKSRTKRRLRMIRGEPVSVRSLGQILPWKWSRFSGSSGARSHRAELGIRSWGGYIIVHYYGSEQNSETQGLGILNMRGCEVVAEIDIPGVMRREFPHVEEEFMSHALWLEVFNGPVDAGRNALEAFHLYVQDRVVLLGIRAISFEMWEDEGPALCQWDVDGTVREYYFTFSLTTGDFIRAWEVAIPWPNEESLEHIPNLIASRVNPSILCLLRPAGPSSIKRYGNSWQENRMKATTYSLRTGEKLATVIANTIGSLDCPDFVSKFSLDSNGNLYLPVLPDMTSITYPSGSLSVSVTPGFQNFRVLSAITGRPHSSSDPLLVPSSVQPLETKLFSGTWEDFVYALEVPQLDRAEQPTNKDEMELEIWFSKWKANNPTNSMKLHKVRLPRHMTETWSQQRQSSGALSPFLTVTCETLDQAVTGLWGYLCPKSFEETSSHRSSRGPLKPLPPAVLPSVLDGEDMCYAKPLPDPEVVGLDAQTLWPPRHWFMADPPKPRKTIVWGDDAVVHCHSTAVELTANRRVIEWYLVSYDEEILA